MITPSNGRFGAAVAVHSDRMVNLVVYDANGHMFPATSRTLLQDDDVGNEMGGYCQWMPYQKGQAAALEGKVRG